MVRRKSALFVELNIGKGKNSMEGINMKIFKLSMPMCNWNDCKQKSEFEFEAIGNDGLNAHGFYCKKHLFSRRGRLWELGWME